jgi:L-2-hydroxyglutarate oxidase
MLPSPALNSHSYVIVGGGIIGLALGHRLLQTLPGARVTVLEKENDVGQHQSGHNSGVLHAGLYYAPGSLKARLAVTGIRQMVAFCRDHAIPHETCGKLVVATCEEELPRLRTLLDRGTANGLRGLAWLDKPEALREIEPHATGLAAVRVPEEGIVDYPAVCRKLVQLIRAAGGEVRTQSEVHEALQRDGEWILGAGSAAVRASYLFNCAGLHCDRVAKLAGERPTARIVPFRGEYFTLTRDAEHLVRHLIYPVPDPKFPFLGVHYTRMIHGGIEAGPNAVLAMAREGYSWRDFSARDLADSLSFPGLWRFLRRYPSMAFYEVKRSLSRREFCRSLQKLVPEIEEHHLQKGGAGVRAQAIRNDGMPLQDFEILERPNAMHLLNAPSPGATASLAIADYLIDRAGLSRSSQSV